MKALMCVPLIFLTAVCFAQIDSHLGRNDMNYDKAFFAGHKISALTMHSVPSPGSTSNLEATQVFRFNVSGKLLSDRLHQDNGKSKSSWTYKYNSKGLLTLRHTAQVDTYYFYNADGQLIKTYAVFSGEKHPLDSTTFRYTNNRKTESTRSASYAQKSTRRFYTYDNQNRIIKIIAIDYADTGKMKGIADTQAVIRTVYNNAGKIDREESITPAGKSTTTYTYNAEGDKISEYSDNSQGKRLRLYQYDAHHHLLVVKLIDKSTDSKTENIESEYTYNADGLILTETDYAGPTDFIINNFTYLFRK